MHLLTADYFMKCYLMIIEYDTRLKLSIIYSGEINCDFMYLII